MWIFDKPSTRRFHVKASIIGSLIILLCGLTLWPLLPRYYQAQTTLIFRAPEQGEKISFLKQDLDEKAIQSELDILASPLLTSEVVKRLNLQNDIEFTSSSPWVPLTQMTNAWSASPRLDAERNALTRLTIQHDKRSYTVRFGYLSKDPQKSTEMTALLSSLYLDELSARKQKFLTREADIARSRLLSAAFRQAQLNTAIDELTRLPSSATDQAALSDLISEKANIIQIANNARAQVEEALVRAGNNDADAEIVAPAIKPTSPLFPDPLIFAVALLCASLTFGVLCGLINFDRLFQGLKA